jgi:hypothetical protein
VGQVPSRIPRFGITPGSRPWFLVRHLQSPVLVKQHGWRHTPAAPSNEMICTSIGHPDTCQCSSFGCWCLVIDQAHVHAGDAGGSCTPECRTRDA